MEKKFIFVGKIKDLLEAIKWEIELEEDRELEEDIRSNNFCDNYGYCNNCGKCGR